MAALELAENRFDEAFEYLVSGADLHALVSEAHTRANTQAGAHTHAAFRDSALMQAMLKDATVQASLAEPRVLRALRRMAQSPSTARLYLLHHQLGPLLIHISHIFATFEGAQ